MAGMDAVTMLLIAETILVILLMIIVGVCIVRMRNLYRRYDIFMRGRDAESLEDLIVKEIDDITELRAQDRANKDIIRNANKNTRSAIQKVGLVKYNAFEGMGGELSFSLALLDYTNTGFILNSVHSREGCYLYCKEVDCGKTEVLLGAEEQEALERALGYIEKEQ